MVMVPFFPRQKGLQALRWTSRCSSRCPSRCAIFIMVIVLGLSLNNKHGQKEGKSTSCRFLSLIAVERVLNFAASQEAEAPTHADPLGVLSGSPFSKPPGHPNPSNFQTGCIVKGEAQNPEKRGI